MKKPELLAPAGNLEKIKIAFKNGADAVYTGVRRFGLRKYADNLTIEELEYAVTLANKQNKKLYLVLNGLSHDTDINSLKIFLTQLNSINPHGLIIADIGVMTLAKELSSIPLHISTQANITNYRTALLWKEAGAERVVTARELSLKECLIIKEKANIEIEVFIHGSMCSGYSGKCVLSNYTAGRDANRGGCIQNCRHKYTLYNKDFKETDKVHLFNSRDLMCTSLIPDFILNEVSSLKIEGRMKSNMYIANTVRCYRFLIDYCYKQLKDGKKIEPTVINSIESELKKVSNRTFWNGFISEQKIEDSVNLEFNKYFKEVIYVGTVKVIKKNKAIFAEIKSPYKPGEKLECQTDSGAWIEIDTAEALDINGEAVKIVKPNSINQFPYIQGISELAIIRRKIDNQ